MRIVKLDRFSSHSIFSLQANLETIYRSISTMNELNSHVHERSTFVMLLYKRYPSPSFHIPASVRRISPSGSCRYTCHSHTSAQLFSSPLAAFKHQRPLPPLPLPPLPLFPLPRPTRPDATPVTRSGFVFLLGRNPSSTSNESKANESGKIT